MDNFLGKFCTFVNFSKKNNWLTVAYSQYLAFAGRIFLVLMKNLHALPEKLAERPLIFQEASPASWLHYYLRMCIHTKNHKHTEWPSVEHILNSEWNIHPSFPHRKEFLNFFKNSVLAFDTKNIGGGSENSTSAISGNIKFVVGRKISFIFLYRIAIKLIILCIMITFVTARKWCTNPILHKLPAFPYIGMP